MENKYRRIFKNDVTGKSITKDVQKRHRHMNTDTRQLSLTRNVLLKMETINQVKIADVVEFKLQVNAKALDHKTQY